jgi:predicted nucleotidyltransferase
MNTAAGHVTKPVGLLQAPLEACIQRELPHLNLAEVADLARIVSTLVRTFQPERIYVFGSQARGTPTWHSDVDLLVVVPDAGEFPHHLEQAAYRAIGHHLLPLEIVFMSRDEFAWRAEVVSSLPATVLREGRTLYAAA